MKRIHEYSHDGYSWSTREIYFLCDSEEEYEELKKKYSDKKDTSWMQYSVDCRITCSPQTTVSDGYAVHGGKKIDAIGITIRESNTFPSGNSYTTYTHYIKPDTEKIESVKTESWWV